MASLTKTFVDLNFELKQLNWRSHFNSWRQRRTSARHQAHNLARPSTRDLRDLGINPAQFEFDLNHGGKENNS
jgi:uncharacterized protein YjiS (DUF1127 family)